MEGLALARSERGAHYLLGMDRESARRYRLFDDAYHPGTEASFAALGVRPDMRVLEVGCGIGLTACRIAEHVVPDGHVVAFDQSQALIDAAKALARDAGVGNVTFFSGAAQEEHVERDSFDVAHTRFVLTYSPDAGEIVRNIHAALKPTGRFLGEEVLQAYATRNPPKWFQDMRSWFADLIEAGGGDANYGLNLLPSHMLEAGFRELRVTSFVPVDDQGSIVEMLRLALSHEMKRNLVELGIATGEEIEADLAAMGRPGADQLVSAAMAIHVAGTK
jgi:ubiquinone/menaquinone biosynthesis C-methylase UbiE